MQDAIPGANSACAIVCLDETRGTGSRYKVALEGGASATVGKKLVVRKTNKTCRKDRQWPSRSTRPTSCSRSWAVSARLLFVQRQRHELCRDYVRLWVPTLRNWSLGTRPVMQSSARPFPTMPMRDATLPISLILVQWTLVASGSKLISCARHGLAAAVVASEVYGCG